MLKILRTLYRLAKTIELCDHYIYPISKDVVLGKSGFPFKGLYLSEDTLHVEKTAGANQEILTLTFDATLGEYVIKPAKTGTGSLFNISILGDGTTRAITTKTDGKVGIKRVPTTRDFEVGGDAEVLGQQFISPASVLPPLVLNANAQGQLVTGLNTEKLGGTTLAGLAHVETIDRSFTDVTVGSTVTETSIYSLSIGANSLGTNKGLRLTIVGTMVWNAGAAGDRFTIKVKLGATTLIANATAKDGNNAATRNVVFVITLFNTGAANTQEAGLEGKATIDATSTIIPIGGYGTAAEDTTSAKTLDVTVQWTLANAAMTFTKKYAVLERLN